MVLHKLFYIARIAYHDYNTIWRHRYKVDLGIGTRWSLGEKIKYNRLGYTNEDYHCFDLKHRDYRNYISYRERWRLEDINGRFAFILGEKLIAKPTRSVGGGTGVHLLMQKGDALFVDDREVSPDQLARAVSS